MATTAMSPSNGVQAIRETAEDARDILNASGSERERIALGMIKRGNVTTQRNGWMTAADGWRRNRHSIQVPVNDETKETYRVRLTNARSHIGLPDAKPGMSRRKEMYAYSVVIVLEFTYKTEEYLKLDVLGEEDRCKLLCQLAGMKATLAEYCYDLAEYGEMGMGVELPDDDMKSTRMMTKSMVFERGGRAAEQALKMRVPDGVAPNPHAMGACLFWYAKNMLSSGACEDDAIMLTVLQQAWDNFAALPPEHMRKAEVRSMIDEMELRLGQTVKACDCDDVPTAELS